MGTLAAGGNARYRRGWTLPNVAQLLTARLPITQLLSLRFHLLAAAIPPSEGTKPWRYWLIPPSPLFAG